MNNKQEYTDFYEMILNDLEYWKSKIIKISEFFPDFSSNIEKISEIEEGVKFHKKSLLKVWSKMEYKTFQNVVCEYCNNIISLGAYMPYVVTQALGDGIINAEADE